MPRTVEELTALLDLETIDQNLFRGEQQPSNLERVFGGQVAAQALVAADRTVDDSYVVHSLHAYFLQPGDTAARIVYDVERLRDGRSFATRRVLARQHGRPIFAMTVDLQRPEEGRDHQDVMPDVPAPEDCLDPRTLPGSDDLAEWDSVQFRYVGSSADLLPPDRERPGRQRFWLRVADRLPDEPLAHTAGFAYLSDLTLMGAALAPHGLRMGGRHTLVASLDHAIWFHRPFRVDEWLLYDQVSPAGAGARGLVTARVFTQDGTLVASVAQEALLRPLAERPTVDTAGAQG
ncbi:acyl-CoA thioesterase II [Nocardioides sp. TRM66260-LWL]|uniref:acyl-CoA thioesterase n=1 Tax=Nocardioides sp. TRM66260-LWL TaxID=2874478 RepID=UPI001CC4A453|nr:acyl-CoA thioesterase II [Nocardioides sp. TRM66260-LWL]MBZ5733656.1 acyl-CoA thioesterase II [Nocardioides sp. TRM66260-LWL]